MELIKIQCMLLEIARFESSNANCLLTGTYINKTKKTKTKKHKSTFFLATSPESQTCSCSILLSGP